MHSRPAPPAPRLIDRGMPKLYALDLRDLPDANTADPADLSGSCGCIGIDAERRDNRRALFRRLPVIGAARRYAGGKLDACPFGDLPDTGDADAADLSRNCGRIGIDVECCNHLAAFFFCELFPWHGRVAGHELRNTLRSHRRPINALDGESVTTPRILFSEVRDKDFPRTHQSLALQTGEIAPGAALLKLLDTESRSS
jgi:hypothetical protein